MTMEQLTEHEAWCSILDILEGYGMVPHMSWGSCNGLCEILYTMNKDGAISGSVRLAMRARIWQALGNRESFGPYGKPKPRIPYVRRFIKATAPWNR